MRAYAQIAFFRIGLGGTPQLLRATSKVFPVMFSESRKQLPHLS